MKGVILMFQCKIENFRNIKEALVPLDGISLVCGNNGNGKSNFALSVAAAACGEIRPIIKQKKTDAWKYVGNYGQRSMASIFEDDNQSTVIWPDNSNSTKGSPLKVSRVSVGLENPITDKNKNSIFSKHLNCMPSKERLKQELSIFKVSDSLSKTICDNVEFMGRGSEWGSGWDSAYSHVTAKKSEMIGQWREVTKANYGKNKIHSWLPENWNPDLENASRETLEYDKVQCQEFLELTIKELAVDESEVKRLQRWVELIPQYEDVEKENEEELEKNILEQSTSRTQLYQCKRLLGDSKFYTCPSCNAELNLKHDTLLKPVKADIDREFISSEIVRLEDELSVLDSVSLSLDNGIHLNEERLNESREAQKQLDKISENKSNTTQAEVDKARTNLQQATNRLECWVKYDRARDLAQSISDYANVETILSPKGIRKEVLSDSLSLFNNSIQELISGIDLKIDDDLNIIFEKLDYDLGSRAEKLFCDFIIRIIFSIQDESKLMVFDDVDWFDHKLMGLFVQAVKNSEISSVLCMKVDHKNQIPDYGLNHNYWIENGTLKTI